MLHVSCSTPAPRLYPQVEPPVEAVCIVSSGRLWDTQGGLWCVCVCVCVCVCWPSCHQHLTTEHMQHGAAAIVSPNRPSLYTHLSHSRIQTGLGQVGKWKGQKDREQGTKGVIRDARARVLHTKKTAITVMD